MPHASPCPSDDIYMVIKSLLECRLNSTLAELKQDYDEKVGDNRLPRSYKDLRRLMQSMQDDVECITNHHGLEMWQVKRTSSSSHESKYKYMKKSNNNNNNYHHRQGGSSKRPRRRSSTSRRRSKSRASTSRGSSSTASSLQQQPQPKRHCYQQPPPPVAQQLAAPPLQHFQKLHYKDVNQNELKRHKDLEGYLYNYQLMGDDFLLSLAKIDLGYKFQKDPKTGRLCIGYCVSGLTIKGLAHIVRSLEIAPHVIVYIGTVDILTGSSLESIKHDYCDLLSAFRERGVEPLLCTLAPVGECNRHFDNLITEFNVWLTNRKWTVVDIDRCFIDDSGRTIRSVYQKDPRNVSGCHVRHLLWNKLGRQRVMKRMKQFIGYIKP